MVVCAPASLSRLCSVVTQVASEPATSRASTESKHPAWLRNLQRVVDQRRRVGKLSRAAVSPNVSSQGDLMINFEGFMNWYKRFESRSGKQLLAVNFDTSVLAHLKEASLCGARVCAYSMLALLSVH